MKLALALFGVAVADLLPPGGCPKITCVMFCKDGMAKDSKGCDICSCARTGSKLAVGTASCKRDADGCCSDLGVAWCPDQNVCVSTHNAVIPCKSWANNAPAAAANAQITVMSGGVVQSTTFDGSLVQPSTPPANSQASFGSSFGSSSFGSSFATTTNFAPAATTSSAANAATTTNFAPHAVASTTRPASACSPAMCMMYCPNGFKKDANGCNMCSCAAETTSELAPPTTPMLPVTGNAGLGVTTSAPARSACSPVVCAMFCPNGFQKDAKGCDICSCAGASPNECPKIADCAARACPGGYAKDSKGCPTCICHTGSAPVSSSTSTGIGRQPETVAAATHSDALVALDRPTIASNPCLPAPGPCKKNQKCIPTPKQCVTTPCPQYKCVKRTMKNRRP